jgi:iron complex outermembrane receptor protein
VRQCATFSNLNGLYRLRSIPFTQSFIAKLKMKYKQPLALAIATLLYPSFTLAAQVNNDEVELAPVTITDTREAALKSETSASTSQISQEDIEFLQPGHPSEVLNRMPGVHVNVTGGEGHMTAIRQPITTGAVYLYLEDGIPTRSTGFFNHNALYEINVPQSAGIEVSKGPGSALHGSDAMAAVINVSTKAAPEETEGDVSLEVGSFGWQRLLLGGGTASLNHGIRADLNLTHTDGWRDSTEYDRQSANVRLDSFLDDGTKVKTVLNVSNIDQQTAGSSRLLEDDYKNHPTRNYTPISMRKVESLRLSSAFEKEVGASLYSVTPYFRYNSMELLPNWSLSYDPNTYKTENKSAGVMMKYRQDFTPMRTRLIVGTDIDYSPGSMDQNKIDVTKEGNYFVDYTVKEKLYDYDVTFSSISPYAHIETSPTDKLRVNAGLRFDHMRYDYENNLTDIDTGNHRRPEDTDVEYQHLSPKLGMTYAINDQLNTFASYRHAFRVPSQGQLFRQGKATNTVKLDPVKVDNYEIGLRGNTISKVNYEISVYYMVKEDDILTFKHADGSSETMNAGKTLHQGIETGLTAPLSNDIDLAVSYAYTEFTYEDWKPNSTIDYSDNQLEAAPRDIGNVALGYHPSQLNGGKVELELSHLGQYWMDQANTETYKGHQLLNIRFNYPVTPEFKVSARILNLEDKTYATNSTYKPAAYGNPETFEYSPGMPRTAYVSASYSF